MRWILVSVVGCAAVAGGTVDRSEGTEGRPHIILCMADDQGWGDMAYNGHPILRTPVFDAMSETGLRLDRFYAASPVCSPTRASVLTGRTPNRSGVFNWGHSLRPQEVTLAAVLREAGYITAHFGKWHVGSVLAQSPTCPGALGFDHWLSAPNFFDMNPWLSDHGKALQFEGESSAIVVDAALEFIRSRLSDARPIFAVLWFGSPHRPHEGLAEDLASYADQPERRRHFLAEITAMDRGMGKLRASLREWDIADNTLLWYCSDNGALPEGSSGGLRGRKGEVYEGGLRVPCLIEWPRRIREPRRSDLPAGTVDIYPTLLEIAGARPAHQPILDGESLLPLFDGLATERRAPLGFWHADVPGFSTPSDKILAFVAERQRIPEPVPGDHPAWGKEPAPLRWDAPDGSYPGHAAWLDGPWKLHRKEVSKQGSHVVWELYHLATDPREEDNRVENEPARAENYKVQLEAWLRGVTESLRGADYAQR
jgi:arylsulfatase A-like enzyme